MPASNIDLYRMQDARRINIEAMRPAPVCTDANQYVGQCQSIHISTNCYYGYHDPKTLENVATNTDCEMMETEVSTADSLASTQRKSRKRSADDVENPHNKRFREGYFQEVRVRRRSTRRMSASHTHYLKITLEESQRVNEDMVPSTTTYNPRLLRPTHNNPDISRCLMVHMI